MVVPVVGPVIVLGYLAATVLVAIESTIIVGGASALGAALYGIGIPKDSVIEYEAAVKADCFLVMAHGPKEDMDRAKAILGTVNASRLDMHVGGKAPESAEPPIQATG